MNNRIKYFIGKDSSCHNYLVPVSMRVSWEKWLELDEDDERSWTPLEGVIAIDGISEVEFYLE